jgi:hypothetical protein
LLIHSQERQMSFQHERVHCAYRGDICNVLHSKESVPPRIFPSACSLYSSCFIQNMGTLSFRCEISLLYQPQAGFNKSLPICIKSNCLTKAHCCTSNSHQPLNTDLKTSRLDDQRHKTLQLILQNFERPRSSYQGGSVFHKAATIC